jgi:hypothetical protein
MKTKKYYFFIKIWKIFSWIDRINSKIIRFILFKLNQKSDKNIIANLYRPISILITKTKYYAGQLP